MVSPSPNHPFTNNLDNQIYSELMAGIAVDCLQEAPLMIDDAGSDSDTPPPTTSSASASNGSAGPKRPRTAYNLFFREQRERLKHMDVYTCYKSRSKGSGSFTQQQQTINVPVIVSFCWKAMSPAQKVRYDQMAANGKFSEGNPFID